MIGDDTSGKDSEPMTPMPIGSEPLRRSAPPLSETGAPTPADMPWADVPAGRVISFTAWGVAGIVGILLWVLIIKLV